jgi:hypothetical protein
MSPDTKCLRNFHACEKAHKTSNFFTAATILTAKAPTAELLTAKKFRN